ncbi:MULTISPECIES: GntR family transcriptional regulator [Enterococcaceae]|uniref:GntR family transcriptional regulator n=2 Tax=Lactobacillales TaxID=186826 RepID=UPI000E4AE28F|nr:MULTISPECIES: GntR family transcriptional regulator [Enterococcaceae]MCI0129773.1 GntR family transcriptional regulator [Vagococcus sp. CY53-2]RGI31948.1 GntR family transcriptional regulator [Melissococcus sp. OM08-11BH]UNM90414.1 GntR family transcriptional regulator [Vagococcus sp. CY52-2]
MIEIDTESIIPIYSQLMFQIKRAIVLGNLKRGQSMPSVRSLAGDIGVNLHTINKAYKLLVEEGVLVQEKKGFTVSCEKPIQTSEENKKQIQQKLDEIIIDGLIFDLDIEALIEQRLNILEGCEINDLDN